jgi:hypothetical protein
MLRAYSQGTVPLTSRHRGALFARTDLQRIAIVSPSAEATTRPEPSRGETLDAHAMATVSRLASLILPRSVDGGVPAFVDRLLSGWYATDDRDRFVSDLAALDDRCRRDFGAVFLDTSAEAQRSVLIAWDTEVTRLRADTLTRAEAQRHLFARLKTLAIIGHFTSADVLQREPVCEGYDGHAPYETTP